MVNREWRSPGQHDFTDAIYGESDDEDELLFSIRLHHYGTFSRKFGCTTFDEGVFCYVDFLSMATFCMAEMHQLVKELGYDEATPRFFYFQKPNHTLDEGVLPLLTDTDVRCEMFPCITLDAKVIDVFVTRFQFSPNQVSIEPQEDVLPKKVYASCSTKM
ncbi:hypothetical protein Tco_1300200 [Tanacetum coccineum]